MIARRLLIALIAAVGLLAAVGQASASERAVYDAKAFAAAQAAGRPIMLEVHANWCPTCAAQNPIIGALEKSPNFAKMVIFEVDFDSRKDLLRQFKVQKQSTLIVFRGAKEVGRSTGDTNAASIKALLSKGLPQA